MLTTSLSPASFVPVSPQLMEWLGELWNRYYDDRAFPKLVCAGHGIQASQLYLDLLETLGLRDRAGMPIFHRERWHAVTILLSRRGYGDLASARLGAGADVGPQPVGGRYVGGAVLPVGGQLPFADAVCYPVPGAGSVMTAISDGIVDPDHVLVAGNDFAVAGDTVFFRKDKDPFALGFPSRALADGDREVLLWCTDSVFDRNWLSDFGGAVFGTELASTALDFAVLSAVWDLHNFGATEANVSAFAGAVFGAAVAAEDGVVEVVDPDFVATSAKVYGIGKGSEPVVGVGDAVVKGQQLSDAVSLYYRSDVETKGLGSAYVQALKSDVPAIAFTPAMSGLGIADAVSALWAESDLRWAGTDSNGNPVFEFDIGGAAADVYRFWSGIRSNCESLGISQADVFAAELHDEWFPSAVVRAGRIVPAQWLLSRAFAGVVAYVVADLDAVDGDTGRVSLLRSVLPLGSLVFVVGKRRVSDTQDFDDVVEDTELGAGVGVSDTGPAVAREHVFAKWVAVCG